MAEDEYEYELATPEQILRIATHFILKSPNGEVDFVVDDVKTLVDESVLDEGTILEILRQYNKDQYVFATTPDGDNLMVSEIGYVDGDSFYNPKTGKVYEFDHIARSWSEGTDSESKFPDNSFRSPMETALQAYMEDCYVNPDEYSFAVYASSDTELTVIISCERANMRAFWSGGWKGTITVDTSGSAVKVSFSIKINVHYFENGNVQLNSEYLEDVDVERKGDDSAVAEAIVEQIRSVETGFQTKLEEMYVNMHGDSFKAMRRFLPKTRKKMEWTLAAHRVATELGR